MRECHVNWNAGISLNLSRMPLSDVIQVCIIGVWCGLFMSVCLAAWLGCEWGAVTGGLVIIWHCESWLLGFLITEWSGLRLHTAVEDLPASEACRALSINPRSSTAQRRKTWQTLLMLLDYSDYQSKHCIFWLLYCLGPSACDRSTEFVCKKRNWLKLTSW